jgi:hypothetical protein
LQIDEEIFKPRGPVVGEGAFDVKFNANLIRFGVDYKFR